MLWSNNEHPLLEPMANKNWKRAEHALSQVSWALQRDTEKVAQ